MDSLLQKRIFLKHFSPPIEEDFHCSICHEVLLDPILTVECGHNFCRKCIQGALEKKKECPLDRTPLGHSTYVPDKRTERLIFSKTIVCPNKGCNWTNRLTQCTPHLAVCDYEVISCTLNCGISFKRLQLDHHLKNECIQRTVTCEYCHNEYTLEGLQSHSNHCPKTPLDCPNGCSTILNREDIENHRSIHCGAEIVSCPFNESGCKEQMMRSKVKEHINEFMTHHFVLFQLHSIRERESLKLELRKMDDVMSHLKKAIDEGKSERESFKLESNKKMDDVILQLKKTMNEVGSLKVELKNVKNENEDLKVQLNNANNKISELNELQTWKPLTWLYVNDSLLTFSNNFQTAKNNTEHWINQPFGYPITEGYHTFYFQLDSAVPSNTMEIGVCLNSDCDKLRKERDAKNIRNSAYLFSWNNGTGYSFSPKGPYLVNGGFKPKEVIQMIINIPSKTLTYFNKDKLLHKFTDIPTDIIPIVSFGSKAYNVQVTLLKSKFS